MASDRGPRGIQKHVVGEGQPAAFNLRQPPARLLATICRNIAVRAGALIGSPSRIATVRAVLLSWTDVMIPSGSETMPPRRGRR